MDNLKCRRARSDEHSIHSVRGSSASQRVDLNELRYLRRKTDSFLPSIPRGKRTGECDCDWHFCDGNSKSRCWRIFNKQTSSSTAQARQLMPTGFKQFWLRHKPSLAIQPSTFYQDIDSLSIEIVQKHNEPHLVLPSLKNKLN